MSRGAGGYSTAAWFHRHGHAQASSITWEGDGESENQVEEGWAVWSRDTVLTSRANITSDRRDGALARWLLSSLAP